MALIHRVCTNYCPLLNSFYCKHTVNIKRYKSKKSRKLSDSLFAQLVTNYDTKTFNDIIQFRRNQASRSILVQLQTYQCIDEFKHHCDQYGKILNMFHYITKSLYPNFILVEFASSNSIKIINDSVEYMKDVEHIPLETTMLWFRKKDGYTTSQLEPNNTKKFLHHCLTFPTSASIMKHINQEAPLSEQMIELHNLLKFTDIETRLRFYTAFQLELTFSKLFPTISILPFGSSVTGFGQKGCDLDLVCQINNSCRSEISSNLVFHSKPYSFNERHAQKEFLSILASVIHNFIPGTQNIQKILEARVPIIKFVNMYTHMQCDLCVTNKIAIRMSEVLFMYGEMDWRVKPLVCTIRKWAYCRKITNLTPGRWITNFSLTLLIIFYLQKERVLPPMNTLSFAVGRDLVGRERYVTSFIQQANLKKKMNEESVSILLYGFFEYYATFKFSSCGICIQEGKEKSKRESAPLYIYNPFEPTLNVSRNVNMDSLNYAIVQFKNALSILQNAETGTLLNLFGLTQLSAINNKNVAKINKNNELNNNENNMETTNETDTNESNKIKQIIK
ncbi:poly(A) RNA polymerase, mitochondrial [Colletes gigas]|uniref:poly(A) RNA polymerase, mitochondrial n=1 Tax=Colletes gigas TaxID=935657 RepID=UPI001C9A7EAF|nr:poly(A) RNA polymerase, mitochondrial [Colletes gigas]